MYIVAKRHRRLVAVAVRLWIVFT